MRKLRKSREGIDASKLIKGDIKKKKKKAKEEEEPQGGLKPGASSSHDVDECVTVSYMIDLNLYSFREEEDAEMKARRVVRTNNFTQQTNALDVDKHMCVYNQGATPGNLLI